MGDRDGQKRLKAALFYGLVLLLVYLLFRIFQPFLVPLGWAAVLAVVFYPVYRRLRKKWSANSAAFASLGIVTVVLIVPAILVGIAFVREGIDAAKAIQQARNEGRAPVMEYIQRGWDRAAQRVPSLQQVDPQELAKDGADNVGRFLATQAGKGIKNLIALFFDLFVLLFALFYLFRDGEKLVALIRELLPFEEDRRSAMMKQAHELIQAGVTSHMIIAATQGLLGGIAFVILGVPSPVFWGVVMAFLSLLPVLGSWLIWLPTAIVLMVTGHLAKGIILIGIGVVLIGLADNVMRPWLLSSSARLNGLVIFISVLGGLAVLGTLGLVLGPIVVALTFGLAKSYAEQARKEVASSEPLPEGPVGTA